MDGPKNAPLNVAIYCRVGCSEYALQIQKQRAAAVIREHDDWNFATTYTDFGTGPQFNRRPSFQMMMADCRKGLIDKILVRSISTLARDVWSCMKVLRELSALGVTIRFMDENIDTETDSQWMEFLNFYSALSAIGHEEIGAAETSDIVPALQ